MSSANKRQGTLAARLTIWNAAIYIAFFGSAFLLFYASIHSIMHNELDEDLEGDFKEYRALLDQEGIKAVQLEMEREILSEGPDAIFFQIQDRDGQVIYTTNLSGWNNPDIDADRISQLSEESGTVLSTIESPDEDHDARVLYGLLDDDLILYFGESMEEINDHLELLSTIFLVTFTVVIVFASIAGWVLARHALRGVEEVTRAAVDVSNGTLDRRVDAGNKGAEIEQLAATFNAMLDRIHTLISGMREMTDNVAHDMRSPLARIRANAEMALSGEQSVDDYRQSTAETIEECDRLLHMINTTLDVAETEAGAAHMDKTNVDISRIAQDACELFTPLAEDKGISIASDIEPGCIVTGNLQLLQRMLANILDNALKYSDRNSCINVVVNTLDNAVMLRIRDEGVGISPQNLKKIFERFFRGDESRSKSGCGLGLSLVRAVIIAHGGDIDVSSSPGNGSEFRITLPA